MPLYRNFRTENGSILIWKYSDNEHFNFDELVVHQDVERVKNYHPKKLLEYLMIRHLLKTELPNHQIKYKKNGEPFLVPNDFCISISHSFPFASLAISKSKIGIDLEKINPKIPKIKHKFLNENELIWIKNENELEYLTIIWTIKEALYKLHSSKYWSLKKHYEVESFDINNLSKIKCKVFDDDFKDEFEAEILKFEDYYFAVICQSPISNP